MGTIILNLKHKLCTFGNVEWRQTLATVYYLNVFIHYLQKRYVQTNSDKTV